MARINPEIVSIVKVRDNGRCRSCGMADPMNLHVDHIVPQSLGGSDKLENLQTLCGVCNNLKGNVPLPAFPIRPAVVGFGDFREIMENRDNLQRLVKIARRRAVENATETVKIWRAEGMSGLVIRRRLAKMVPSRHIERILLSTR